MSDIEEPVTVSLSPDLWAKVFAHLDDRAEISRLLDLPKRKHNQAEVHQLKLVCKQFKQIRADHSEVVQRVYLCPEFSVGSTQLVSLATTAQELPTVVPVNKQQH